MTKIILRDAFDDVVEEIEDSIDSPMYMNLGCIDNGSKYGILKKDDTYYLLGQESGKILGGWGKEVTFSHAKHVVGKCKSDRHREAVYAQYPELKTKNKSIGTLNKTRCELIDYFEKYIDPKLFDIFLDYDEKKERERLECQVGKLNDEQWEIDRDYILEDAWEQALNEE